MSTAPSDEWNMINTLVNDANTAPLYATLPTAATRMLQPKEYGLVLIRKEETPESAG